MGFSGKKSIQVVQQEIRSKIENFDWETNPHWQKDMIEIDSMIKDYWSNYLTRPFNLYYGKND